MNACPAVEKERVADARRYFGGRVVKIVPPWFPSFGYGTIISRYSAFYVRRIHRRVRDAPAPARARARDFALGDKKINRPRAARTCPSSREHRHTDACIRSLSTRYTNLALDRCAEQKRTRLISFNFSRSL